MEIYRAIFPGAVAVIFGYGKRTFVTATPDDLSEWLLGPVPGPAVIEATGLSVMPADAYARGDTIELSLSAAGVEALSRFIWNDFRRDRAGKPLLVGPDRSPGGLFYAAQSQYSLFHTCNRWALDALAAAGLPISGESVIFSGQAMGRAEGVQLKQCNNAPSPP